MPRESSGKADPIQYPKGGWMQSPVSETWGPGPALYKCNALSWQPNPPRPSKKTQPKNTPSAMASHDLWPDWPSPVQQQLSPSFPKLCGWRMYLSPFGSTPTVPLSNHAEIPDRVSTYLHLPHKQTLTYGFSCRLISCDSEVMSLCLHLWTPCCET